LLGKSNSPHWKIEYEDSVYKIYDKNNDLTGYFFPNYPLDDSELDDDRQVSKLVDAHATVFGGRLMLPMLKLNILDVEEGQNLENIIHQLSSNVKRAQEWRNWYISKKERYEISGCLAYTAREDRQMLSVVLSLGLKFTLGTKEILNSLALILEDLTNDSMI
jgi:hypothetical protein